MDNKSSKKQNKRNNNRKHKRCEVIYYNPTTKIVACKDNGTNTEYQLTIDNYDNSGYITLIKE